MLRTVFLLVSFLGIQFCKAQDFIWATQVGGKSQDFGREIIRTPSGYILPIQFSDSFYALGKWFNRNSLNKRSLFLCFYSLNGTLYKIIRPEHDDSIQIGRFNNELRGDRISFNAISIVSNTFINGKYHDPHKYNLLFELDTNGKFHEILRVSCIKKGTYVKPSLVYFGSSNSSNNTIITINLRDTNCTYYINDDSIALNDSGKIALIRINKLTLKLNWTLLYNNFTPSRLVAFGSGYMMCCSFNDTTGVFKFKDEQYQVTKTNRIFILTLDNLFAMDTVYFIKGNLSLPMYNRFSVNSTNGFSFIPFNVVEYNDTVEFEGKNIPVDYAAYCYINYFSNGKIQYSKLITKQGDEIWNTDGSFSNYTIESKGQFNYLSGSTYLPLKVYPDSLLINCRIRDPDFFLMKLDTFGNILWYLNFGKKGSSEYANPVIIEDDGVVVSGTFDSTTTLGNYTLTSNGGTDALLFKITDNSIYRGNIKKGPYCAGDSIEVPYRAYGKYADTNTFFAELSDENGNFYGTPRQLGSLKTNALQGTIRGVLPLFDVVSSGKYRIRIRSNSPFVQSFMRYDSLYLLIYSKDKANPGADTTICVGEALQLKTTGGTRWHWSPGTAVTDSTARVTQFVGKQNTRLRIAISDSSGCGAPDTAWKYIALYPKLAVTARDTVVCRNTSFHITATVEGGRPSSRSVQWYAGTTYLGKDTLKSSTWFDTSFMAVATDGCASNTDTTRVRVSLPNPPSLNINDTTVCAGSLLLWQPTITGYKGRPVQLSWYRGTTKLSDSLLQLQVDSNQVLWLYGDDNCAAAENRKEVHIEVFEKPTVSVVIDSICAEVGHKVMFTAAGGKAPYTYWLNDQQVSKSAYALVQPAQWLRWYAQDACQQKTVLDSVLVHQQPRGQIMAAPENGCAPLMVSLRSNQTNTTWYIENNSIQGQDTLPYGFTKAGVYTVKMVVENGECKDSVSKQIEVYEAPKAWFEIQQRDLLIGEARTRVINTSGPAKRYIWYWKDSMRESSSLDAWALHLQDTGMSKVWMIAENIRGCRDTFTDTVYVHPQPILWIPTAITLNGDGLNDALAAGGIGLKSYRFMVFNRWGEMVFSGKENEEWRPSSTVLPGMYVYRCIYSNWKGTKFEQNGTVMLLR
jgi:hypothetical protein